MTLTPSTMLELGKTAPEFSLPSADGFQFILAERHLDKGLLVIFMCNHCPYVIHIREELVFKIRQYQVQGIEVVAINSNDFTQFPDDNPERMLQTAQAFEFSFPYLVDEDQQVAKAYRAACTPDFFLFDADRRLVYRGQFDGARPGNSIPVTGEDLTNAVSSLIADEPVSAEQKPSMGCNIKWKEGNAPDYFA
ncbi:thioredoxin family protein [Desulfopila inferna]|uniref:thioredoxin family protein n=1 Tax=Desulfopila inferna TaxID=468528 RepID=UPI0019647624|nr:thioredoxin family protein [Desulfopila inferna]MBM9605201.1 thioredoxin family protein [Desulfopila inferna]